VKSILALAGFLLLSFLAAWVGALYAPGEWYASLAKPAWNPPNWVFAPVWTVLYVLIGWSGWLVWRAEGLLTKPLVFAPYFLQLLLNAAWSWLFFGLHQPALAFGEIVFLWLAIFATVMVFWRRSRVAALLLLPYLAWVSFAALLNLALWRLNP
jgi:tryptophan-rich sensory protein